LAYDPAYNKQTWSSEELATSTKLNQMVDNTDHNYKYKPELGPDAPTNNPIKLARGTKKIIILAAETGHEEIVTFSSDSEDGNPGFINTPKIVCNMAAAQDELEAIRIDNIHSTAKSNTSFTIYIYRGGTASANYWFDIDWIAIGN